MNSSELQIWNLALDLVGQTPVVTIDENSIAARKCRLRWYHVREAVFRSHPWKCISKQASLTAAAAAPLHNWLYAFPLPADYVRMIGMDLASRQYKTYGSVLYTNTSPAEIDYVYRCTDCTRYTGDLEKCLYLNLAYELAYSIPQSVEIADRIKADLEKFFLPLARFTDSVEGGSEETESDTLTDEFND